MKQLATLILLLCGACGTSDHQEPADLLDRDRFKTVLLEAQLVEARMNHEMTVLQTPDVNASAYYEAMFEDQHTTKDQFNATLDHYSKRPEELKVIYEEIITELSRRKDEVSSVIEPNAEDAVQKDAARD